MAEFQFIKQIKIQDGCVQKLTMVPIIKIRTCPKEKKGCRDQHELDGPKDAIAA
jgi:hypothetical protein